MNLSFIWAASTVAPSNKVDKAISRKRILKCFLDLRGSGSLGVERGKQLVELFLY